MYHSRVSRTSWFLANSRINHRERDAMKRQIPRGEPRIFPFVRHRNDVGVVQVLPIGVAAVFAFRRRRGWADRPSAIRVHRNNKIVCTRSCPQTPDAARCAHRHRKYRSATPHKIHRPRGGAGRKSHQSPQRIFRLCFGLVKTQTNRHRATWPEQSIRNGEPLWFLSCAGFTAADRHEPR